MESIARETNGLLSPSRTALVTEPLISLGHGNGKLLPSPTTLIAPDSSNNDASCLPQNRYAHISPDSKRKYQNLNVVKPPLTSSHSGSQFSPSLCVTVYSTLRGQDSVPHDYRGILCNDMATADMRSSHSKSLTLWSITRAVLERHQKLPTICEKCSTTVRLSPNDATIPSLICSNTALTLEDIASPMIPDTLADESPLNEWYLPGSLSVPSALMVFRNGVTSRKSCSPCDQPTVGDENCIRKKCTTLDHALRRLTELIVWDMCIMRVRLMKQQKSDPVSRDAKATEKLEQCVGKRLKHFSGENPSIYEEAGYPSSSSPFFNNSASSIDSRLEEQLNVVDSLNSISVDETWVLNAKTLRRIIALTTAASSVFRSAIFNFISKGIIGASCLFRTILDIYEDDLRNFITLDQQEKMNSVRVRVENILLKLSKKSNPCSATLQQLVPGDMTASETCSQLDSSITVTAFDTHLSPIDPLPIHSQHILSSSLPSSSLYSSEYELRLPQQLQEDARPMESSCTTSSSWHPILPSPSAPVICPDGLPLHGNRISKEPQHESLLDMSDRALLKSIDYTFHVWGLENTSITTSFLEQSRNDNLMQDPGRHMSSIYNSVVHGENHCELRQCVCHIVADDHLKEQNRFLFPLPVHIQTSMDIAIGNRAVVVLISGASGCGKSTLAYLLANRLGLGTVLSTDTVRHILRCRYSEEENPILYASTYDTERFIRNNASAVCHGDEYEGYNYHEGMLSTFVTCDTIGHDIICDVIRQNAKDKDLGQMNILPRNDDKFPPEPNLGNVYDDWKTMQKPAVEGSKTPFCYAHSSALPAPCIRGFLEQANMLHDELEFLIEQLLENGESVVVEGAHLTSNFISRICRRFPKQCIAFLIYISDESTHTTRFANRSRNFETTPAKNKYVKHLENIRAIQNYLRNNAVPDVMVPVDNTSISNAMQLMHSTVVQRLRMLC